MSAGSRVQGFVLDVNLTKLQYFFQRPCCLEEIEGFSLDEVGNQRPGETREEKNIKERRTSMCSIHNITQQFKTTEFCFN